MTTYNTTIGMCPKCQRWLTVAEPFCPRCGLTIGTQPTSSSPPPNPPSLPFARFSLAPWEKITLSLAGMFLVGLGAIAGLLIYYLDPDPRHKEAGRYLAIWGIVGMAFWMLLGLLYGIFFCWMMPWLAMRHFQDGMQEYQKNLQALPSLFPPQ